MCNRPRFSESLEGRGLRQRIARTAPKGDGTAPPKGDGAGAGAFASSDIAKGALRAALPRKPTVADVEKQRCRRAARSRRGRRRARSSTYLSLDELFRLTGLHLDHLDEPAPSAALPSSAAGVFPFEQERLSAVQVLTSRLRRLISRPRGLMDKASDSGSEDCGFDSHRGYLLTFCSRQARGLEECIGADFLSFGRNERAGR